jgi:ADP-ribose pyrophosphatase
MSGRESIPPPETVPPEWTDLHTEELHDCRVFRVGRVRTRSPRSGDVHDFYRIDASDWVNVVPVTAAGEVVMVRQYRHGLRALTLEIPGGMVDAGESPEEAAARELLEETGHRAAVLEPLGSVNPNPALFGNRVHMYVARGAERVGPVRNEGLEETVVELIPGRRIADLLRRGAIDHALVVAALYRYDLAEREREREREQEREQERGGR